ncbi:cell division protein FtsQ/DivIB [Accumulibacter sp.]|uniref:cell division protein FtsQ/DivIB n=1 Tax=Accumulibacter sp. TaxID=2053492 RepID=UPI0025E09826|nr:cell division protein FtsQ/DivIB [Accumulibacter sp.]
MTAVSDLLFLAAGAALLAAAVIWGMPRLQLLPLREVRVTTALQEVQRAELEQSLDELLRGSFLTVNLEALRLALEQLPWVRRAEVWRKWPPRIDVELEEQRAVAHWGDGELVNTFGEVFAAVLPDDRQLPRLSGPPGTAADVLRHHEEFAQLLRPIDQRLAQVALSPRLAWALELEDGMVVELGREQAKAPIRMRLQRFVDYYPTLSDTRHGRPLAVDMRYPNGFALRFAASTGQEGKGKK